MRTLSTTVRLVIFLIVASTLLPACQREYNLELEEQERETLGHEIHAIWRKDAARSAENADTRVAMLDAQYVPFVDAVDAMVPEDELQPVNIFLQNMMALVDEGFLPTLTRKIIVALREAALDTALLASLASPSGPAVEDFISPAANPNFLGYATNYEGLPALTSLGARAILENDGLTDAGVRTFDEPRAVSDLTRILVDAMRNLEPAKEDSLPIILRDLLLVQDERYAPEEATLPVFVARFDDRGYPLASTDAQGVVYPFTDANGDGLADINAQGEFVLGDGGSAMVRPFAISSTIEEGVARDGIGRAEIPGGGYAFEYVDLQSTGLGFLIREFHGLASKDTLYDILSAFQSVLGAKVVQSDDIGGYEGYPADQPLMDLTYALVHTIDFDGLGDLLEGFAELMDRDTDAVAALLWNIDNFAETVERFPEAELTDDSTLVADLTPYLNAIASDPQLWSDVMRALRDPVTVRTGEALSTMIRFSDRDTVPQPDGPYDACFQRCQTNYTIGTVTRYDCIRGCPNGEIFSQPTDFDAAESELTQSQLQAFLHLLRDTRGQPYAMQIEEASINGTELPELPPLIALPGAAEAMVASIAGNLDLADYVPDAVWNSDLGDLLDLLGIDSGNVADLVSTLSVLFGTSLDRIPRPDQITRLFNQKDLRAESDSVILDIAEPRCRDGFKMAEHLAYGLFVAEASGTIDTVYPLAKAFSDNGREDILTGIFTVLHDHYASGPGLYQTASGSASLQKGANLRSYEPAMEQVLGAGELFDALRQFAVAVEDTEDATGLPMEDSVRRLVERATVRDGFTAYGEMPGTPVILPDNRQIAQPARLDQVVEALDEVDLRLEEQPEVRERLGNAVGNVTELLIGAEKDTNGVPRFNESGSVALTVNTTRWLADRVRDKESEAGGVSAWVRDDLVPMLEDLWSSRLLTALVDLTSSVLSNEADRAELDGFIDYQFQTREGVSQFIIGSYELLVQSVNTARFKPLANFLAEVLDPDREWQIDPYRSNSVEADTSSMVDLPIISLVGQILARTLEVDPDNEGIFLIHRSLDATRGESPISVIVEVIARYLSPDPSKETFDVAEDYRFFFNEMSDYMADDVNGLERLYEVVDLRARE